MMHRLVWCRDYGPGGTCGTVGIILLGFGRCINTFPIKWANYANPLPIYWPGNKREKMRRPFNSGEKRWDLRPHFLSLISWLIAGMNCINLTQLDLKMFRVAWIIHGARIKCYCNRLAKKAPRVLCWFICTLQSVIAGCAPLKGVTRSLL